MTLKDKFWLKSFQTNCQFSIVQYHGNEVRTSFPLSKCFSSHSHSKWSIQMQCEGDQISIWNSIKISKYFESFKTKFNKTSFKLVSGLKHSGLSKISVCNCKTHFKNELFFKRFFFDVFNEQNLERTIKRTINCFNKY